MKKLSAALLLIASLSLTGCNTIAGVGQDVSAGGQAVSKAAYSAKQRM